MIKAELVRRIAESLSLKDREALQVVDKTIEALKNVVAEQGRLEIRDFGVFQTKTRKARVGRNPKDKKEYPIPARRVVTFKMGRELKMSGEAAAVSAPVVQAADDRAKVSDVKSAAPGPANPFLPMLGADKEPSQTRY